MSRTNVRAGLLALLVVLTAAAGGSPAASAAEPTLRIREAAAVQARGAGIVFEAVTACPAGSRPSINARVTQRRADGSTVSGTTSQPFACTGTQQVVRVVVTTAYASGYDAKIEGAPFAPGTAFVSATTDHCDGITCQKLRASQTVQTPALALDSARLTGLDVGAALPSSAALEADGAGVKVRVPYRCPTGVTGSLSAVLVQRTSAGAVTSAGSETALPPCTGVDRTAVLAFHPWSAAWKPADALLIVTGSSSTGGESGPHSFTQAHRVLSLKAPAGAGTDATTPAGEPFLRVREAAGVQARGAGIAVDLVLTCAASQQENVAVEVTQRQPDGSLVRQRLGRPVTCTGSQQSVRAVVHGLGTGDVARFRPGAAFVTATLSACDGNACHWLQGSRTVQARSVALDAARLEASRLVGTLPGTAALGADGAVRVVLPYRCPAGFTGPLSAHLAQRTPAGTVMIRRSDTEITCTGGGQSGVLSFDAGAGTWTTGTALLRIDGFLDGTTSNGANGHYAHRTLFLT